ncbi:TnsD family transposase [Desulforamulus ruminis]|uniref:TnsD family transposase n=1 Tax=Desulforamulus ruminis TaxID=1564 RepID=UPI002FD9CDB2
MLPFFPEPHPDELLYSVFARYHIWSRNISYKDTVLDLFGTKSACAVMDLPNHLADLYKQLPLGSKNTTEKLIQNHTLFPLYRPFLPQDRADIIQQMMLDSNKGGRIHTTIGVMASNIRSPRFLKYCTECFRDDESIYGEPYWHRTHQVFGIFICPIHKTWLVESNVAVSAQQNKHVFEPLLGPDKVQATLEIPTSFLYNYLFLSESVYWLLNNDPPVMGLKEIREGYLYALKKNDLATFSGRVRQQELINCFRRFYGIEFLKQMDCTINLGQQDNWLSKLVREPRCAAHPIRHLLLMRFLGHSPENFFTQKAKGNLPFSEGPWFCLNAAASHYGKPVIYNCSITRDYRTGLPVGTFTCSCGFIYSRKGPDKKDSDKYKIGRIKEFGPIWEKELLRIWKEDYKGLRDAGRRLKVDPMTIKRQLNKLVFNDRIPPLNDCGIEKRHLSKVEDYRSRWLMIVEKYSGKSKTELRKIGKAQFAWLYRHDRSWLDENSPKPKKRQKHGDFRVNWLQRDQEILNKVIDAVNEIKSREGKLTRVTISSIGKAIGDLCVLQKHLDKLPCTKMLLQKLVETEEDFQIRRVSKAAERLRAQDEPVKLWKIIRESGLRPNYSERVTTQIESELSRELSLPIIGGELWQSYLSQNGPF